MKKIWIFLIVIGLLAGLTWVGQAAPQAFSLDWWTVDSGAGTSQGGGYSLSGSIGQPDTGQLSGGGYTLNGGFWRAGAAEIPLVRVLLPIVIE